MKLLKCCLLRVSFVISYPNAVHGFFNGKTYRKETLNEMLTFLTSLHWI
ncbi:MAG: hypothetical protein OQK09_08410 [Colwellia sp.]|nr:hypothetical protein [Colwellia sp.]MCW9081522.1 hypothetical protein [Colwellia sp.]